MARVITFIMVGAFVGILVGIVMLSTTHSTAIPNGGMVRREQLPHLPGVAHPGQAPAPSNSSASPQTFPTHLIRILFALLGLYLMLGQASKPAAAAVGSTIFMTVVTLYIGPLIH